MNSITQHLTAESIIATLKLFRSAKSDVVLVVEGDDDIAFLSGALSVPKGGIVSCFGKERLMEVFSGFASGALDPGMIFFRDRDFDGVVSTSRHGVHMYVSDHYDFEMGLLSGRIFDRVAHEFFKTKSTPHVISTAKSKIMSATAQIGALRSLSAEMKINLDFKEMDLKFVSGDTLEVDQRKMIRYFFQRSGIKLQDHFSTEAGAVKAVSDRVGAAKSLFDLCSGKDFIRIMSVALHKLYKTCPAAECAPNTLARMMRIGAVKADLSAQSFWKLFCSHVLGCGFAWRGVSIP